MTVRENKATIRYLREGDARMYIEDTINDMTTMKKRLNVGHIEEIERLIDEVESAATNLYDFVQDVVDEMEDGTYEEGPSDPEGVDRV